MLFYKILCLIITIHLAKKVATEFVQTTRIIWRDYIDYIPGDAIIGATDEDGNNIYIAQTAVKTYSIPFVLTTGMKAGATEVYVAAGNPTRVETLPGHVKILCGAQQNLDWFVTNNSSLQELLYVHRPVLGGFYSTSGRYVIGRLSSNTSAIGRVQVDIGQFCISDVSTVECWYSEYEVLLFK